MKSQLIPATMASSVPGEIAWLCIIVLLREGRISLMKNERDSPLSEVGIAVISIWNKSGTYKIVYKEVWK